MEDNTIINVLLMLINNKLADYNSKKETYKISTDVTEQVNQLVHHLEDDFLTICDRETFARIKKYLEYLDDQELKRSIESKTERFTALIKAKENGIVLDSYMDDEIEAFALLKKGLLSVIKKNNAILDEIKADIQTIDANKNNYAKLYDKILVGSKGLENFTNSDLDLLKDILLEANLSDKEIIDIYTFINKMISKIAANEIENVTTKNKDIGDIEDIDDVEQGEIPNEVLIDDETIARMFEKYGYDYNKLPPCCDKIKLNLRKYGKLTNIENIFKYVENHLESFSSLKIILCETERETLLKFTKLVNILIYSNEFILDSLLQDSLNRNINVVDVLEKVEGVFKRVKRNRTNDKEKINVSPNSPTNNSTINGSFDYYLDNVQGLDSISLNYVKRTTQGVLKVDFTKDILEHCPSILTTLPEVLFKNFRLLSTKGFIKFFETINGVVRINCPSILEVRELDERINHCLEHPIIYQRVKNFPSLIKCKKHLINALYYDINDLWDKSNMIIGGPLIPSPRTESQKEISNDNLSSIINDIPEKLREDVNSNDINYDIGYTDYILNLFNNMIDYEYTNGFAYNINGTYVAINKFKKIWQKISFLISNKFYSEKIDERKLILYALTFNSFYSDKQLKNLKSFVENLDLGGIKNGILK